MQDDKEQKTLFPTLEEALHMHKMLIDRYGGAQSVRDLGLLESALFRPQTGYYESLDEQAAALLQSLAKNHPFVDGNKRVAMTVTLVFLRINGQRFTGGADETEAFLINKVIKKSCDLKDITLFLRENCAAL